MADVPWIAVVLGWVCRLIGRAYSSMLGKHERLRKEKDIIKSKLDQLECLIAECRRKKMSFERRVICGSDLKAARDALKNYVHMHTELKDRLWRLVRAWDDYLGGYRRSGSAEYRALDAEIRLWRAELRS